MEYDIFQQSGVIPFCFENGELKILLITTRKSKRWILPKGIIEPKMSPEESAAAEAYEEAGIRGEIYSAQIGEYHYPKWGGTCNVKVFAMEITQIYENWPESNIRKRKWVSINETETLIDNPQLKSIIRELPSFIEYAKNQSRERLNNSNSPLD